MKKTVIIILLMALSQLCYTDSAWKKDRPVLERNGDVYYAKRNSIRDIKKAVINMDMAVENYEKAFQTGAPDVKRLFKYIKAVDFKYRYLAGTAQEKKILYESLIQKYEPFKKQFSGTKEFNYCMVILWGRRGEITQNIFDTSNGRIAENIMKYAGALYRLDKKFESYAACKILGRIHYKTPNIPFMLTWPDRKKSKAYLEEMAANDPENTEGSVFLADTIWDEGDRKTAARLYRRVSGCVPRENFWFYDNLAIKMCNVRMKELGVKMDDNR